MAQVKFGNCLNPMGRSLRPYDIPSPYPGYYTYPNQPQCKSSKLGERVQERRRDIGAPKWTGLPVNDMCEGTDNVSGIGSKCDRPMQMVDTEQGPVCLPYGEDPRIGFTPTASVLHVLPHTGSKMMGLMDRNGFLQRDTRYF